MPKYSIKTLLLLFAVLALWLSAATGYAAASDVRMSITSVIFLGSAFAAAYFRGRRRAFWLGFFVMFLLMACPMISQLIPLQVPQINWQGDVAARWAATISTSPKMQSELHMWLFWTIKFSGTLALTTVMGFVAAHIYDQSREAPTTSKLKR